MNIIRCCASVYRLLSAFPTRRTSIFLRYFCFIFLECPRKAGGEKLFACPSPISGTNRYVCIDDHALCDRRYDCPGKEDEDPTVCMFHKMVGTITLLILWYSLLTHGQSFYGGWNTTTGSDTICTFYMQHEAGAGFHYWQHGVPGFWMEHSNEPMTQWRAHVGSTSWLINN
jgi:hypothetical protein